jgi:hypothetical protein
MGKGGKDVPHTHLEGPRGDRKLSLIPVARRLSELLGTSREHGA